MSATLLLLLGAAAVFAGFTLALCIVGVATAERRGVSRSLAVINALNSAPEPLRREIERPFAERVLAPLGGRLVGVGRRLIRADTAERLRRRLDIAGNPSGWDVERIIGVKVLGLAVLGGFGFAWSLAADKPLTVLLAITAGAGGFGFVLPNLLLHNAGQKRESQMSRGMADALDLLTISVEAGLGFDAALGRVARNTRGPLAGEFARVLQEMQIGVGRMQAMRALGERSTLPELRGFVSSMVQADAFGIPIGEVLRVQSKEMRVKRRQVAEEKAQKVPVKILFPLIFFILPTMFIVILGPTALGMVDFFGGQQL
jgi:tight adherence protein C